MEIILIILTGTIMAAGFLYAFKLGYEKGRKENAEGLSVDKYNARMLREYANFISYMGDERGE